MEYTDVLALNLCDFFFNESFSLDCELLEDKKTEDDQCLGAENWIVWSWKASV